jgi:hypothetical protein
MQIRAVVIAWLLMLVTLVGVALASTNWYEYRDRLAFGPGTGPVLEAIGPGWEPTDFPGRETYYWRRPRLYLAR